MWIRTRHPTALPPAPPPCPSCDQHRATIGQLTTRLARASASLAEEAARAADALREVRQLREQLHTARANETAEAAHWRRLYEREHATNALLDDRLAAAEGRPTFAAGVRS